MDKILARGKNSYIESRVHKASLRLSATLEGKELFDSRIYRNDRRNQ
jgi:hypothetical protein